MEGVRLTREEWLNEEAAVFVNGSCVRMRMADALPLLGAYIDRETRLKAVPNPLAPYIGTLHDRPPVVGYTLDVPTYVLSHCWVCSGSGLRWAKIKAPITPAKA